MHRRPPPISSVESHLVYWVNFVGFRTYHELRLRTQKFGVTAAESVVLRTLYEKSLMPSHLATDLGRTRGTISKLAKRLEAKGLIDREKSRVDRRAQLLSLTGIGRALVHLLAGIADKTELRNFLGTGELRRQTIRQVLNWIVRRDHLRFVPPEQPHNIFEPYRFPQ